MNSLRDLNDYAEETVITITDDRDSTVIFDRSAFYDITTTYSSATITVTPNFNIEEVVDYPTANCRYRISIISNSPTFIANSYVNWSSALPAGVGLSGSGGVYTLTGINSKTIWNAVKTFTWSLPANWATYTSFYLRLEVIYYDEALGTTETRNIDYYDPIYYPISKFQLTTSLTCAITYNIVSPSSAMSLRALLFVQGENFIPFVGFSSSTAMTSTAKANKRLISTMPAVLTTTNATPSRTITPMLAQIGSTNVSPYPAYLKVWKYVGGSYIDYSPSSSSWSSVLAGSKPFSVEWAPNNAVSTGNLALFIRQTSFNPAGKIIFYRNINTITKLSVEITPPLGSEVGKMRWNYDGSVLSWTDTDDKVSSALVTSTTYTMIDTPALRDYQGSTTALAWHPNSNILAISSPSTIDLLSLSGTTLSYINSTTAGNFNPADAKRDAVDMDWHPSGNTLATVDGILTIFNFNGSQLTYVNSFGPSFGSYSSVAWSPNGTYLAAAVATNRPNESYPWTYALKIFKKTGDTYTELSIPEPSNRINSLSWSADSSVLSVAYQSFAGTFSGYIDNYVRSGDTFTKVTPSLQVGTGTLDWRKP